MTNNIQNSLNKNSAEKSFDFFNMTFGESKEQENIAMDCDCLDSEESQKYNHPLPDSKKKFKPCSERCHKYKQPHSQVFAPQLAVDADHRRSCGIEKYSKSLTEKILKDFGPSEKEFLSTAKELSLSQSEQHNSSVVNNIPCEAEYDHLPGNKLNKFSEIKNFKNCEKKPLISDEDRKKHAVLASEYISKSDNCLRDALQSEMLQRALTRTYYICGVENGHYMLKRFDIRLMCDIISEPIYNFPNQTAPNSII
jgi:hypothetical protein